MYTFIEIHSHISHIQKYKHFKVRLYEHLDVLGTDTEAKTLQALRCKRKSVSSRVTTPRRQQRHLTNPWKPSDTHRAGAFRNIFHYCKAGT